MYRGLFVQMVLPRRVSVLSSGLAWCDSPCGIVIVASFAGFCSPRRLMPMRQCSAKNSLCGCWDARDHMPNEQSFRVCRLHRAAGGVPGATRVMCQSRRRAGRATQSPCDLNAPASDARCRCSIAYADDAISVLFALRTGGTFPAFWC